MKQVRRFLLVAIVLTMALAVNAATVSGQSGNSVRVWVEYGLGNSEAVRRDLLNAGSQFHYDFPRLNSYVVTMPAAAMNGIQNNPNVIFVEEDAQRQFFSPMASEPSADLGGTLTAAGEVVPYGIDSVQARDIWDTDRDGAADPGAVNGSGRTVCIIDTGFYGGHEDFAGINVDGYSQQITGWSIDGNGHGSHVAGTINAMDNNLGVIGVNPGSISLYIVKIFDDNGTWTNSSDLVDALNRCAAGGANVISMSLGGGSKSRSEENAFNSIHASGILSIAAAGNDGNNRLSYPASYDIVMSVGALDSNNVIADFSQFNRQVEISAPGVHVLSTVPYLATNSLTIGGTTYVGGAMEGSPTGSASGTLVDGGLCDSTGSWSGAVVMCQRGNITFADKVLNVQNSGGVAAIVYNNAPGNFAGTLGGTATSIISMSMSQEDGQFIVANSLGQTGSAVVDWQQPASGYEYYDGTSMATPHVSAVAGLIWSANPSWTNDDIRNAMTSTALDLGAAGRDDYYGYGLVQAADALNFLTGGGPVPTPVPTDPPTNPTPTPAPTDPPPGGNLTVTVATDKSSYTRGEIVYITVTVTDGGSPVEGAMVNVTINAPKSTLSGSSSTGADGTVTFTYKVNSGRDGKGTYTVTATATKAGYNGGSGSTSFQVN